MAGCGRHRDGLRARGHNHQKGSAENHSCRCGRCGRSDWERDLLCTAVMSWISKAHSYRVTLFRLTVGCAWSLSEGVPALDEEPGRGPGPMGMESGSSCV
jgi:hypothetical protein